MVPFTDAHGRKNSKNMADADAPNRKHRKDRQTMFMTLTPAEGLSLISMKLPSGRTGSPSTLPIFSTEGCRTGRASTRVLVDSISSPSTDDARASSIVPAIGGRLTSGF